MSDQVELTNPVELSVGGMSGHVLRRAIHLGMSFIPLLYFEIGNDVADAISLTLEQVVSAVIIFAVFAEAVRLRMGWTIVVQRSYEALILSLSLGDPLLGELRRNEVSTNTVIWAGAVGIALIWASCAYFVDTPWFFVALMGPICVASEWPRLRYIDDNATMLLIPLAVILVCDPFLGIM